MSVIQWVTLIFLLVKYCISFVVYIIVRIWLRVHNNLRYSHIYL